MSNGRPRSNIPYGHIVMGAAGWIAYLLLPFISIPLPETVVLIFASLLTILAIPRFIRGPRQKAHEHIMAKFQSSSEPRSKRLTAHMLATERFRMELHEHPIVLIWWWLGGTVWSGLAVAVALHPNWNLGIAQVNWTPLWVLACWGVGMIPVLIRILLWRRDRICVTNKRIFAVEGLIELRVSMIPLNKVTDKLQVEPWHGRILEWLRIIETTYGLIRLETAGKDTKLSSLVYLPNVVEVMHTFLPDALPDKAMKP